MPTRRRKTLLFLSVLLLLSLFVTACAAAPTPEAQPEQAQPQPTAESAQPEPAAEPAQPEPTAEPAAPSSVETKDTLIWAQGGNPIKLDPTLQESIADYNTYAQIYDSLLFRDREGQFQPKLAESWDALDDLTWEIKLRQGIKFHNGEELTADVVQFTIDRILNPDNASQLIEWFGFIDTIEVIDDHTLRLTTTEPTPTSLVGHALSRTWPVPRKLLEEKGDDYLITNPVGTGPYKFVEWRKDEHVKLERFEDYWGPKPAFKNVIIRIIPDATTRAAALAAGEVDIVHGLSLTDVPLVEQSGNARVEKVPGGRIAMIQFALLAGEPTTVDALRDKRVRQALAHAIDVENGLMPLMEGNAEPIGTMVCPVCFGYDPRFKDPIPYDPERAKALLAEAGYPDGFKMTLATASGSHPGDKATAEAVAGYWAAVGVEAEVQPMENTAFLDGWKKHTLGADAYNHNLLSQNWDADGMLARRFREGEIMTYWFTAETNELLDQAALTVDPEERQQLYSRVQEIVREEVPIIPLFVRTVIFGVSNDVEYTPRADEWPFLQYAEPAK